MTGLLEIRKVNVKSKSLFRLRNIFLKIYQGEKIALLGKSGSGKSTLISVANGSLIPSDGDVTWRSENLKTLKSKKLREIGTLWQDLRLVKKLNSFIK